MPKKIFAVQRKDKTYAAFFTRKRSAATWMGAARYHGYKIVPIEMETPGRAVVMQGMRLSIRARRPIFVHSYVHDMVYPARPVFIVERGELCVAMPDGDQDSTLAAGLRFLDRIGPDPKDGHYNHETGELYAKPASQTSSAGSDHPT